MQRDPSGTRCARPLTVAERRVYHPRMSVRRAIWRAAALGLAAALAAGAGRASDRLDMRLRQVEGAFREGDAAALRPAFATSGKIRVDLRDLTEGQGWYASGQLRSCSPAFSRTTPPARSSSGRTT